MEDEEIKGERLLVKVMTDGRITYEMPTLEEMRKTTLKNLSELPEKYKRLANPSSYPVELSRRLSNIRSQLVDRLRS